jgi:hypothetical protein
MSDAERVLEGRGILVQAWNVAQDLPRSSRDELIVLELVGELRTLIERSDRRLYLIRRPDYEPPPPPPVPATGKAWRLSRELRDSHEAYEIRRLLEQAQQMLDD